MLEGDKTYTNFAALMRCVVPGSHPCTGISIIMR